MKFYDEWWIPETESFLFIEMQFWRVCASFYYREDIKIYMYFIQPTNRLIDRSLWSEGSNLIGGKQ